MSTRDDDRKLFEHFVIAGLSSDTPEQLSPSSQECGCRNTQPLAPITDICIIFPSQGEAVPEGFEIIDTTPLGHAADLNHGSIRMPSVFLCFRRGYHKPALLDIGILDEGRGDKPMIDSHTVKTSPYGRPANVNNASQGIFLTYRRAQPSSAPSQFVVTHICVILTNRGELPPHTYYKIPKNLNKGMVGSDVYICYKKSQGSSKRLAYKPSVLDYFPKSENDEEEFKLAQNIPMFCLPMGALIECWPVKCQPPDKTFSTFVLTDENGNKFYGAAVAFYEKYQGKLNEEQLEALELDSSRREEEGGAVEDSSSNNDPADEMDFHTNVAICIISKFPFFTSFKRFLFYIHRISSCGGIYSVPIERYISHLMYEVSFPTPRRPRVLMQLGAEQISFDSHDDSQLPLSGAQLYDTLKSLGPDNLMYLMLLALLEQKILVHSLRPWMLTAVSESVCALMFPFHWQCPYIPQCPLGLAGVLHAPLPFIAGVDSRYFELYEDPPSDVTCFDLDTSTISWSTIRHNVRLNLLPKKPARQLRNTLEALCRRLSSQDLDSKQKSGFVPVDQEFANQKKRREIENEIHDAFLKFMVNLMRGYQSFLRPIKCAPSSANATDTGNLFDLDAFLRSRDKSGTEFYKKFSETQSFIRFIEERSFVSDKNAYNAFFDDCITKLDSVDSVGDVPLLEIESYYNGNHPSVFIPPPEPLLDPTTNKEREFTYDGFPRKLEESYFQLDQLNMFKKSDYRVPIQHDMCRSAAVRTKPEIRSSLFTATNSVRTDPLEWPKTLLFYSYSLWFMQLPSLLAVAPNKKKILRLAFHILDRLEKSGVFPLDQVCYRILIELCGEQGEPSMAVRVLHAMQRAGVEQNAVTYGIYHRAVMDAIWPTDARQKALEAWYRLRLYISVLSQFRLGHPRRENIRLPAGDTQSVSDGGYHSDKAGEEIKTEEEKLATEPYVISYHPLNTESNINIDESDPLNESSNDPIDPLGALKTTEELSSDVSVLTMSPSRAKFLADHASTPYANELTPKAESKSSSRAGGWLKGITNSPIIKMIRSSTFETPKPVDSGSDVSVGAGAGMSVSPSLHSLVSQVRRGYDDVMKDAVPAKWRQGMSSLVHGLNRSYGPTGSGTIFSSSSNDTKEEMSDLNENDAAYQLDSGETGAIISAAWWMKEVILQMQRNQLRGEKADVEEEKERDGDDCMLEVTLSTCTACPACDRMIYDEEIMAGWKVDDQNMNTSCPYCTIDDGSNNTDRVGIFAPRLTVEFEYRRHASASWYSPGGLPIDKEHSSESPPPATSYKMKNLSVAFISPLVLRRELETILAVNLLALKDSSIMESHPVIFWNLIYYLRRLALPTHLNSWISSRYHIRCVYDRPLEHKGSILPLYLSNPNHEYLPDDQQQKTLATWKSVTQAVQDNQLFTAIQHLVNKGRKIIGTGQITLGPHFPIFRDIQFASLDMFGRSLVRDSLDKQYWGEFKRLPPRILELPLLQLQDRPQKVTHRACRKVFLPLDLF